VNSFLESKGFPARFCDVHGDNLVWLKRDLNAFESLIDVLDELNDTSQIFAGGTIDLQNFVAILVFI